MVLCFSAALNRNITSNLQLWIRRNHSATKNQRLCPKQRIYFAYVVGILITIETYRFIIVKLQRIKNMDKYELQTTLSIEKSLLPITRPLWKKCCHTSDKHLPHFICQASANPECAAPLALGNWFGQVGCRSYAYQIMLNVWVFARKLEKCDVDVSVSTATIISTVNYGLDCSELVPSFL